MLPYLERVPAMITSNPLRTRMPPSRRLENFFSGSTATSQTRQQLTTTLARLIYPVQCRCRMLRPYIDLDPKVTPFPSNPARTNPKRDMFGRYLKRIIRLFLWGCQSLDHGEANISQKGIIPAKDPFSDDVVFWRFVWFLRHIIPNFAECDHELEFAPHVAEQNHV